MEIKLVAEQLDAWALKAGWKVVTSRVSAEYAGELLESLCVDDATEFERRHHNNKQILQRAFRSVTPYYRKLAAQLAPAVLSALEAERKRLAEEENFSAYVAAMANKECSEAINAKLMDSPLSVQAREVKEAVCSLVAMLPPGAIKITIHEVAA